jgi:hypothetical protein
MDVPLSTEKREKVVFQWCMRHSFCLSYFTELEVYFFLLFFFFCLQICCREPNRATFITLCADPVFICTALKMHLSKNISNNLNEIRCVLISLLTFYDEPFSVN